MIRKVIITMLVLGAICIVVLDIVSRYRPLIYFRDDITQPTFWKLYSAQADRGKLRIAFESLGDYVVITEDDVPAYGPTAPPPPHKWTLRDRLEYRGFYAKYSGNWSYGGGEDDNGDYIYVKAMSKSVWLGVPAWFLFILLATYPAVAFIRRSGVRQRYRKKHGLCLQCGYDLKGNESGMCPECGRKVESTEKERI